MFKWNRISSNRNHIHLRQCTIKHWQISFIWIILYNSSNDSLERDAYWHNKGKPNGMWCKTFLSSFRTTGHRYHESLMKLSIRNYGNSASSSFQFQWLNAKFKEGNNYDEESEILRPRMKKGICGPRSPWQGYKNTFNWPSSLFLREGEGVCCNVYSSRESLGWSHNTQAL